jgi:hypothetical protein
VEFSQVKNSFLGEKYFSRFFGYLGRIGPNRRTWAVFEAINLNKSPFFLAKEIYFATIQVRG